jgi:hypothetical protein
LWAGVERLFIESDIVKWKMGANPMNRENSKVIFAEMMAFTARGIVAIMKHGTQF